MEKFELLENTLVAYGELGPSDFPAFQRYCKMSIDKTTGELIVDLTRVDYMTSIYLGALLEVRYRLRCLNRSMKVRPSPVVHQLMVLTGLAGTLPIAE